MRRCRHIRDLHSTATAHRVTTGFIGPGGLEPEQADLFAHNEIDIQAGCEIAFSNLVDAEAWPSWYSNSKDVKFLNTRIIGSGRTHESRGRPSDSTSKAAFGSLSRVDDSDGSEMVRMSMLIARSFLPGPLRVPYRHRRGCEVSWCHSVP
jgi:hypothetical protein